MKIQPRTMQVEIRINGAWILIEEKLTFAEHECNARKVGATEVRSLDGKLHAFLNRGARQ